MRYLAWGFVVAIAVAGCGDKGSDKAAKTVTDGLDRLQKNEADILSRRTTMAQERNKIRADRVSLQQKRHEILKTGGDTSSVDQEEKELLAREKALLSKQEQLEDELSSLVRGYKDVTAGLGSVGGVVRREASVAGREKDFSRRETALAKRETALAEREAALAKREDDMCGGGATIVREVPVATPGSRYSRSDVEPVLRKVRRKMSERGLLPSDLPVAAQGLENEATSAMAAGEYGRAKFAATQLYATVKSQRVGRSFISAKIKRLNEKIKGKNLSGSKRQRIDKLFRDATGDYGDGRFTSANRKLNKIHATLR